MENKPIKLGGIIFGPGIGEWRIASPEELEKYKEEMMVKATKNKSKIWTDCPECAYKHLTAAYALLTGPFVPSDPVPPVELLLARAWITYGEYRAGYKGNLDLAKGCLAAIETLNSTDMNAALRELRLDPFVNPGKWDAIFSVFLCHNPDGTPRDPVQLLVYGHIAEALRECPALLEDYSTLTDCDLSTIIDAIQWVKQTYELGKTNEGQ